MRTASRRDGVSSARRRVRRRRHRTALLGGIARGRWLEVERALAATQAELGIIPAQAAAAIASLPHRSESSSRRLRERTLVVGYPILPLLEQIGGASPEAARYLHWGATTQDIMDTGLALIARSGARPDRGACAGARGRAGEHGRRASRDGDARPDARATRRADHVRRQAGGLARRAHTPRGAARRRSCAGRGRPALRRRRHGCGARARKPRRPARASRSGWDWESSTFPGTRRVTHWPRSASCSPRRRRTCGKLAREVIELSRPEIGEVREEGGHLRGASSTMPQKANPIGSEAVVGLSILAAQHAGALLAAHAGDARALGRGVAGGVGRATPRLRRGRRRPRRGTAGSWQGLSVFPERMRANLDADGGSIMAEAAMMALAGVGRAGRCPQRSSPRRRRPRAKWASRCGRHSSETLAPELLAAMPPLERVLDPGSYLGESDAIVTAALEGWRRVMSRSGRAAGTAPS